MKKILGIFTVFFIVIFMTVNLMANIGNVPGLNKGTDIATTQVTRTMSNISNWGYWIYYTGKSGNQPDGSSGGIYPRGTAGAIYQDGFVWGGQIDTDGDGVGDDIRVGGQTYNIGTQPGCITADGTAADITDPRVKVYRIRSDWRTLAGSMVKQDAKELNELSSLGSVTESMTDAVIAQYEEDWNEWPVDLGAPWTDVNGDGVYDPAVDEAGIADADQVIWLVVNDLSATKTFGLYGSQPIGLELQITMWAYNQPGARLGQIVFKKYKLINKSGGDIDEMYVSQWADPDLGNAGDDFCGCDTVLSMGYAYNGNDVDSDYDAFGLAPAAFGYDFFQGPIVPSVGDTAIFDLKEKIGFKNLPMSTFGWFAAGSPISDPTLGDPEGTRQWYNMLRGFKPFDDLINPSPWTEGNIIGAPTTKFPLAGDPVAGTGFIDGEDGYFDPGDRRIALTAGPFNFADGDTQEVVVAILGGLGDSRLSSITDLKETDVVAQKVYNDLFSSIPKAPAGPVVNVATMEDKIVLEWGSDMTVVNATEVPVISGYAFEGYNVYQFKTATSSGDDAKKIATFDLNNGVTTIEGTRYVSRNGVQLPATVILQNGADGGLKRYFNVDKDYFTGGALREGTTYYFAVTAYNYCAAPELIEDKALESAKIVLAVTVQEPLPGTILGYDDFSVNETTEHHGSADGTVTAKVIDPYLVTGHDYKIVFDNEHYYLADDGLWYTTNYPDSIGKLSKTTDLTGSSLSAVSVYAATAGTVDLKFWLNVISPDYDYCDGVKLTLPSGITINSANSEVNVPIEIDKNANTVMFGTNDTTTGGPFAGGELITVNVNTFAPPLTIDYIMYDDGWAVSYGAPYDTFGDGVVDVTGSVDITVIGNDFKTIKYWNVKDSTDNIMVLENQALVGNKYLERITDGKYYEGGEDAGVEAIVVDGVELGVNVGYAAPSDFTFLTLTDSSGEETKYSASTNPDAQPYALTSYGMHGWSATSRSIDALGHGTTDINYLQRDYELRFTGEYDDPITVGDVTYHPIKEGTGSKAIIYDSRGYDLANHPDSNNPGNGDAFFIQIPFEVWDMEADGGPRQIAISIYDRMQGLSSGDFYAFNPSDRMYCDFLMLPYNDVIAGDPVELAISEMHTWNTVWWGADWTKGDVLYFLYDNPIQLGIDEWSFSTNSVITEDDDEMAADVDRVNVFPNPFYAHNPLATHRYDEYVTFTHLPAKATIQIYNLAGVLVNTVEHNNANSQFEQWDLTNASNLPIASGIYIAYINMPDVNASKILKFVIIQKEQILKYY